MTMNSSFARLWLWIFGIGYAVFVGLLLQTLFTPAPYGDLARIGRISDHDFGWRIDPPRVDPALLRGAPVAQADILVIGDSFSATHRWQSQLAKAGYSVATTYWQDIDETLCDDFDHWLEAGGFRGKLVIIESVERIVDFRLERSRDCRQMKKPLVAKPEVPSPPLDHVPGFALNWEGQIYAGFLTQRCTRAAIAGKKRSGCDQQTHARAVADGCALFSNRRCEMALFLAQDEASRELTAAHAAQLQAFGQARGTVPILWMMVPDKTTTYLKPAHSRDFVKAFGDAGLGPDLFAFAQQQKTAMRDFYMPNDTHISMQGQLVLGDRMVQAVKEKLAAPAAPPGG
jgi:hypothetical protein